MKPLLYSSTFWFGFAQVILGIAGYHFQFMDTMTSGTLIIAGLGTIGFRVNTTQPIGSVFPKK